VPVIVLELDPQASDVPVDDVALRHEVRAPDGVEDLVAGDDAPCPARQQVQEALLDARRGGSSEVARARTSRLEDVDLDLAEA
jgi:hypothetical protein